MAPLKLVLAFFALVILGAGGVGVAYYWENYFRPNWEAEQRFQKPNGTGAKPDLPDLGRREFAAAEELLIEGELQAARRATTRSPAAGGTKKTDRMLMAANTIRVTPRVVERLPDSASSIEA